MLSVGLVERAKFLFCEHIKQGNNCHVNFVIFSNLNFSIAKKPPKKTIPLYFVVSNDIIKKMLLRQIQGLFMKL